MGIIVPEVRLQSRLDSLFGAAKAALRISMIDSVTLGLGVAKRGESLFTTRLQYNLKKLFTTKNTKKNTVCSLLPSFVLFVSFVVKPPVILLIYPSPVGKSRPVLWQPY